MAQPVLPFGASAPANRYFPNRSKEMSRFCHYSQRKRGGPKPTPLDCPVRTTHVRTLLSHIGEVGVGHALGGKLLAEHLLEGQPGRGRLGGRRIDTTLIRRLRLEHIPV